MPVLQRISAITYYPVTEEQVKNGKINSFDLLNGADSLGLFNNEHGLVTDNTIVHIDTTLFYPKISILRRYSCSIYFYLLTLLKDNRQPIKIHNTMLRNESTNITIRNTFDNYLLELLQSGIIFRFKSHEFYINPLFAWVGDRSRYFDVDRMPFKPSDVCADETE